MMVNEYAVYYITVSAMELFRTVLVEVFCRIKMGKILNMSAMPREVIYMLILIPLASLVGCFLLIEVVREQLSVRTGILCMCIIFTIILTDYMVFLMMESYTDMAEKQHEEELVLSEITYQNEYYRDMEQYQEQIQDIKHDMKNRLGTLYDAAGEGGQQHGDGSTERDTGGYQSGGRYHLFRKSCLKFYFEDQDSKSKGERHRCQNPCIYSKESFHRDRGYGSTVWESAGQCD